MGQPQLPSQTQSQHRERHELRFCPQLPGGCDYCLREERSPPRNNGHEASSMSSWKLEKTSPRPNENANQSGLHHSYTKESHHSYRESRDRSANPVGVGGLTTSQKEIEARAKYDDMIFESELQPLSRGSKSGKNSRVQSKSHLHNEQEQPMSQRGVIFSSKRESSNDHPTLHYSTVETRRVVGYNDSRTGPTYSSAHFVDRDGRNAESVATRIQIARSSTTKSGSKSPLKPSIVNSSSAKKLRGDLGKPSDRSKEVRIDEGSAIDTIKLTSSNKKSQQDKSSSKKTTLVTNRGIEVKKSGQKVFTPLKQSKNTNQKTSQSKASASPKVRSKLSFELSKEETATKVCTHTPQQHSHLNCPICLEEEIRLHNQFLYDVDLQGINACSETQRRLANYNSHDTRTCPKCIELRERHAAMDQKHQIKEDIAWLRATEIARGSPNSKVYVTNHSVHNCNKCQGHERREFETKMDKFDCTINGCHTTTTTRQRSNSRTRQSKDKTHFGPTCDECLYLQSRSQKKTEVHYPPGARQSVSSYIHPNQPLTCTFCPHHKAMEEGEDVAITTRLQTYKQHNANERGRDLGYESHERTENYLSSPGRITTRSKEEDRGSASKQAIIENRPIIWYNTDRYPYICKNGEYRPGKETENKTPSKKSLNKEISDAYIYSRSKSKKTPSKQSLSSSKVKQQSQTPAEDQSRVRETVVTTREVYREVIPLPSQRNEYQWEEKRTENYRDPKPLSPKDEAPSQIIFHREMESRDQKAAPLKESSSRQITSQRDYDQRDDRPAPPREDESARRITTSQRDSIHKEQAYSSVKQDSPKQTPSQRESIHESHASRHYTTRDNLAPIARIHEPAESQSRIRNSSKEADRHQGVTTTTTRTVITRLDNSRTLDSRDSPDKYYLDELEQFQRLNRSISVHTLTYLSQRSNPPKCVADILEALLSLLQVVYSRIPKDFLQGTYRSYQDLKYLLGHPEDLANAIHSLKRHIENQGMPLKNIMRAEQCLARYKTSTRDPEAASYEVDCREIADFVEFILNYCAVLKVD